MQFQEIEMNIFKKLKSKKSSGCFAIKNPIDYLYEYQIIV